MLLLLLRVYNWEVASDSIERVPETIADSRREYVSRRAFMCIYDVKSFGTNFALICKRNVRISILKIPN